jgi:hypothetical protein
MPKPAIPSGDLRERIFVAVRDAKKPVTFKHLAKLVKAQDEPFRVALESALGAGQVHRWPDFRRSQYFWNVPAELKAREAILAIAAMEALPKRALSTSAAKNVPGLSIKRMESVVLAMVGEKQLQTVRAFTGNSKLFFRAGEHDVYFKAVRSFVEKKIRSAGFDPTGFFTEKSSPKGALTILEAIRSLEPVKGVPVSTLRLRNNLPDLKKREFDAAALELRKEQRVFLSQHADPYNLSQEDKDLLIDGKDGTYYVAVAIR